MLSRDAAGWRTLWGDAFGRSWGIHVGVMRVHRQWGYVADWYDGPLHSFGLGPLLLVCWCVVR